MAFDNPVVKDTYTGDNSTVTFAIPFEVIDDAEVETVVYLLDTSVTPNVATVQVLGADYSIVGSNVEFDTAPTTDDLVVIGRVLALEQELDLINNGALPATSLENQFDRVVAMIQQLNEKIERAPILEYTSQLSGQLEFPYPVAGSVIGWDPTGLFLQTYTAEELGLTPQAIGEQEFIDFEQQSSVTAPASGFQRVYAKSDGNLYKQGSDAVERLLGQGALTVSGTRASPNNIVAGTGVTFTAGTQRLLIFIQGSGGDVTVSASPPIQAGTIVGQEIILVGRNDSQTVTFTNSATLELNGDITMGAGSVLSLVWDSSAWVEVSRKGL